MVTDWFSSLDQSPLGCPASVNADDEYDTVLKELLQSPQSSLIERITGARIEKWLNVEFPEVRQTRVDLLGQTADGARIVGMELQSTNDVNLPVRMAEYAISTFKAIGQLPDQYVLYVGKKKMRMASELAGRNFHCRYTLVDIRDVNEEALLTSPFDSDLIMAILTNHKARRETIRRILARIATLEGKSREIALKKLTMLAGPRDLGHDIKREVKQMPILDDIIDDDLLGPILKRGFRKAAKKGSTKVGRKD